MGKQTICIGENKGADQLRSNFGISFDHYLHLFFFYYRIGLFQNQLFGLGNVCFVSDFKLSHLAKLIVWF